jgi:hypothetical protein
MGGLKNFTGSLVFSFALLGVIQFGWSKEIGPTDNYCDEINDPSSGTEIVLHPGNYKGGCKVLRSGKQGSPVIIRGVDLARRPRIEYEKKNGNVLEIYAHHIVVEGLQFGPTQSDVDGIRIFAGNDVTVQDCAFEQLGGIAVVANHASLKEIIIRRNSIVNSASTAMYFGCHDGGPCTVSRLLIERNFISGVTARPSEIGYGIQVKLNSVAEIRDNVIVNTKGPGIMVYGSNDPNEKSVIERNFVSGSRESAGIVVGGGPAVVRNNIVSGNSEGGIGLENYRRRGLLRHVLVTYNTLYGNSRGGILVPAEGALEAEISYNAVAARDGTIAFPGERKGVRVVGNYDCSNTRCFVDPENKDFTPLNGSPLLETHKSSRVEPNSIDDYFGRPRRMHSAIGAIQPPGATIGVGFKRD